MPCSRTSGTYYKLQVKSETVYMYLEIRPASSHLVSFSVHIPETTQRRQPTMLSRWHAARNFIIALLPCRYFRLWHLAVSRPSSSGLLCSASHDFSGLINSNCALLGVRGPFNYRPGGGRYNLLRGDSECPDTRCDMGEVSLCMSLLGEQWLLYSIRVPRCGERESDVGLKSEVSLIYACFVCETCPIVWTALALLYFLFLKFFCEVPSRKKRLLLVHDRFGVSLSPQIQ